jgi:hypothetical protein
LLAGCKDLFHPEGPEKSNSNNNSNSNSNGNNNGNGTGPDTIAAPSVPQSVLAKAESSDTIIVAWDPVSEASGYKVYRSSSSSGTYSWQGEAAPNSEPSYYDTGLAPGATYYYKVSAYNSNDKESAMSSYAYATTLTGGYAPSAPQVVQAMPVSANMITVIWDSVSGADGYNVYRSTSPFGAYLWLVGYNSFSNNSYDDIGLEPNTTYYYKVSAYNGSGEGAQSNYVSATTPLFGGSNNSLVGTVWSNEEDWGHIYVFQFVSPTELVWIRDSYPDYLSYSYDGGSNLTAYFDNGSSMPLVVSSNSIYDPGENRTYYKSW